MKHPFPSLLSLSLAVLFIGALASSAVAEQKFHPDVVINAYKGSVKILHMTIHDKD